MLYFFVQKTILKFMNKLAEFLPAFMHISRLENTNLILLLGFILLLGALGGRLFQKLKIPQVVGYIVIGILLGQSGFQILFRYNGAGSAFEHCAFPYRLYDRRRA